MSIQDAAELTGLSWDTVKEIHKTHLRRKYKSFNLKKVQHIAIDEVYLGKKRKYITLVLDLRTGRVIHIYHQATKMEKAVLKGSRWLLLKAPSAPSPAKLAAPSALAAATAAAAPGTSQIEGIGPRYAELLAGAGISSIDDVQTMDIERIYTQTDIGRKRLWNWKAAAILLQLAGVDGQIAEALVATGFTDIAKVALARPMDLYYALQRVRTPREARNIIPDTYRVITPNHARQFQRSAYDMYFARKHGASVPHRLRQQIPYAPFKAAHPSNYGPDPRCRSFDYIVIHAIAMTTHVCPRDHNVYWPRTLCTVRTANGFTFGEKPSTWRYTRSSDYTRYWSLCSILFPTWLC